MKKISIIFVALSLACLGGCFGDDDLPEETQEGKDTFGMLVDGEKWEPSLGNFFYPPKEGAYYFLGLIAVFAENENEKIEFFIKNVNGNGIYPMELAGPTVNTASCADSTRFDLDASDVFNCEQAFKPLKVGDGKVRITRFDTVKQIVSGTFEVRMVNRDNKILEITEGRFDLNY